MTQLQLLFTVLKNETSNWRFGYMMMMMTIEGILNFYRFIYKANVVPYIDLNRNQSTKSNTKQNQKTPPVPRITTTPIRH
jgi:hypothetical protein